MKVKKTKDIDKGISDAQTRLNLPKEPEVKIDADTDITLVKLATGIWKEVSRNTGSLVEADSTAVEFDTDAIDANEGIEFKYTGAASDTLAEILNGVEGTEITIYGQATNTLTVAAVAGKIVLISGSALLDAATKFIKLQKFEGMWFETSRG